MTVLAANRWPTNAELIEDCARLGYLQKDRLVFDPTYGIGTWWKKWKPSYLVTNDINPKRAAEYHHDFTDLPWLDDSFDAIAFDPPYVSAGGRKTTGIPELHQRYGMTDAPKTPAELQRVINAGTSELFRVLIGGGILLVKCQDYVSSGKLWTGTHHTLTHALSLGFELIDRFEHITHPRPQPPGRRQVHARRNLSTLFVFRKP